MKIIIPMAGRGTRLRPHSITVPKPLVPVAGKPIVERLVEDLAAAYNGELEEVAFIIGEDFGTAVEQDLVALAERLGAKGSIYYQKEKLGTAHAILCAQESMQGNIIVAFADTLFDSDFKLSEEDEGVIWVKQVEDPSAYGVVKLDNQGIITDFVEKPDTFVSDLAIVGIYYFKDAEFLRQELQYLLDNNIKEKGEFQLTNALENMKNKGLKFKTNTIKEWLDCGNKNAVVYANQRVLEIKPDAASVAADLRQDNVVIIPPCYIASGVVLKNAVVGPYVSLGEGCHLENVVIQNSLVQKHSTLKNVVLENSMLGNHVYYEKNTEQLSFGDYTNTK